jgi:glycerol-3-phosphate acyltransferase PlsX
MRIILDAMGGDNAPQAVVKGAAAAVREFGEEIVLVGREAEIRRCLAECGGENEPKLTVVNAEEVVTMEDEPTRACSRKKDSSMAVALRMLKNGEGDAVVSAGSTGALLSGATLIVKRIRGIRRAAMGPVLPNGGKGVLLMDAYTSYDLHDDHSEAVVPMPEFMQSFQRFFMDVLLGQLVLSRAESMAALERLLVL